MHAEATPPRGFHPHILPLWVYLVVLALLLVLTAVTVAIAQVNLGPFNLVVAMLVATIKGSLVALFFMHLLYDKKLYLTIFLSALLFLGVFITLTMFDTMTRGALDAQHFAPVQPEAATYVPPAAAPTPAAPAPAATPATPTPELPAAPATPVAP